MGETHVQVLIRNPAEPQRTWEGPFLVGTGANDCHVPRRYLEAIGLKPKGERVYQLADGSVVTVDTTIGEVEFMGEFIGSLIAFGEDGTEPLLGTIALQAAGIEVDLRTESLRKSRRRFRL
ncbi:MAG: clan AA aspartic protease [bacterium]|nr:clan AA aspartic protease [bacterium]MDE0353206.1 clan AA aspartic protease [bacterium]